MDAAIVDLETNKNFSNGRKIADILRYVARLRHEGASNILVVEDGFYTDPGCPKDGPSDCLTRRGDRNHYARRRRLASPTSSTARRKHLGWDDVTHRVAQAGGRVRYRPNTKLARLFEGRRKVCQSIGLTVLSARRTRKFGRSGRRSSPSRT